ncbi:MAG: asparagine synthase (glutamine-hydrolyzing) [Rhodospirillaceae bacterium]|jgi:asparagine synthase (glutamine-hydrolysing)|nr:asparagine synthase (glutamine-hydrolyzing) [Rhodospirillaceae bacterium]|tara:strand:+ start:1644 stop:3653 length:2010 start_codon:yes stop_codon:yes gene_type:complete
MCGIAGILNFADDRPLDTDILEAMGDRMVHRGPDSAGIWRSQDGRCGLGHRRLSIIDLSDAASQPMVNSDGDVTIVFNGEIYNHAEIRRKLEALGKYEWQTDHSDTEVLLHAYEEWGLDCIDRFYGMFAFAVFDGRQPDKPVLHLVRDRVGVKPLYLTRTQAGEWLFASEIRALFAHPALTPEMDRTAFWHYLTFIVAPAPLTMFRGVFKLPAGFRVTIDHNGRATAERYWDCVSSASNTISESDLGEDEAADQLLALLRKSVSRRMVSDVPFGALLSGGIDSSLNVALMSELMDRPVSTFTVGYKKHDDFNEFHHARRVAERYGTQHHEILIDDKEAQDFLPLLVELQDEPIADNVCIPLYFLAKLVRDSGTTVVQVGEGADEHFLGYWWCAHYRDKYEQVYKPARGGQSPGFLRRLRNLIASPIRPESAEDKEIVTRALSGQELFWGGAACWWGDLREKLTPNTEPFRQIVNCPVEGLFDKSHQDLDSHEVVRSYLGPLTGSLAKPEVLQKISYLESKIRLPEHLLMRVDKMTMAHSIEARVPFLDHDIVEFAARLPLSYKLSGNMGKNLLKKVATRFLDEDTIYRKKQGFGAPMDRWFTEDSFGKQCRTAYERSPLRQEGFFDDDFVMGMLREQTSRGGGNGFHLWTILNAVLWHAHWVEGRADTF